MANFPEVFSEGSWSAWQVTPSIFEVRVAVDEA